MSATKRSPEYTIRMTQGALDEISVWVTAVEATAALTSCATTHEDLAARRGRALDEALNLLRILTRRLFASTHHDGDVLLFPDRFSGPHAIGRTYTSGLTGAVIFRPSPTGNAWSSHT